MGIFIISLVVSVIPSIILYKWLVKSKSDDEYKSLCKTSLKKGMLAIFPIIILSFALYIIGRILKNAGINLILYEAYYAFIALALAEELVKYLSFKSVLKNTKYKYNYFDVAIFMSIVGLGFGIIENITYSINSGVIPMLIKGTDLAHAGYGFIVGYFYGKSLKKNNKKYRLAGFLISWLLHGLFDFGLSNEFIKLNDNLVFISISLTLISFITLILFIRYVRKEKGNLTE